MMSDVKSTSIGKDSEEKLEKSTSAIGSEILEDDVLDKTVWAKLDRRILPLIAVFYLLSFLDRTNIGNARVAGLQTDLKMTNKQYSIALTVTYVPYIAAELPSNLMLKAVGPNLMLPTMLSLWGVVATLQGLVKTYSGLLACRFFIGLLEGGLIPGLVLYLSYFYPRYKMALRVSAFFSAATLSGAFGGILAYGITHMDGVANRPGWAWIFILEGIFTVLFGISSYFTLPRCINTARFLSQEEKEYLTAKLCEDSANTDEDRFSWKEVLEAFKLPQLWFLNVAFFLEGTALFGLAYFTPSIIHGLGYSPATTQLMSVPPFAVAFVVAMFSAYINDRYRCRAIVCIVSAFACSTGFGIFYLGSNSTQVQYGSLFLSIPGAYTFAPSSMVWNSNNASPQTRRATVIASTFIMSNSGGILATWLLGSLSAAPKFTGATTTLVIFCLVGALFCVMNLVYLRRENLKKAERRRVMQREEEESGLGNHSAWYIYNL